MTLVELGLDLLHLLPFATASELGFMSPLVPSVPPRLAHTGSRERENLRESRDSANSLFFILPPWSEMFVLNRRVSAPGAVVNPTVLAGLRSKRARRRTYLVYQRQVQ